MVRLDDGVLTALGFNDLKRVGAVGEKRDVAQVGPWLGLGADRAGAAHDHSLAVTGGLGDLPEADALYLAAVHLADEAVNIDRQPLLAGAGTGPPRPGQRLVAEGVRPSV
jgi:hypothetical protein